MVRTIFAAMLLASPAVSAQALADDFHPALDAHGYLTQNGADTLGHEELSFGLGSLEWGHHIDPSVHDMVTATLVGALGLRIGGLPLELGASLPLGVISGDTSQQYVGDVGLHLKARIFHGLGAIASVELPTGTTQLVGVAEAKLSRLRVAVNGGVRERSTTLMAMGVTTSTEFPLGVGAAWALAPDKVEVVGEVFGAIGSAAQRGYQPLEALGGLKVYLAKNSYLSLGAGRGLVPDRAGNPDLRAVISIVFEPKPAPRVAAHYDEEVAELAPPPKPPADAWADRDNDGIPDKDDKCPDDPENYNGYQDDDGCPDEEPKNLVIDTGSVLVTLEGIEFEFDRAIIRPESFKVLDAVAKALADNPDIHKVEVQGHTDEQGPADYNQDLSQRRAAAVVEYLVGKGVASERLIAHGYGESVPLDPSHTQAAYRKNRRVVFQIKDRE
jgi:outer membrane protein OmpA-like peptidoglycan-associated protein